MKKLIVVIFAYFAVMIVACSTSSKTQTAENAKTQAPPPSSIATASTSNVISVLSTDELQQGQTIFSSSCTHCHKLPNIQRYSQEKWADDILPVMFRKARLDTAQQRLVQGYIFSQISN